MSKRLGLLFIAGAGGAAFWLLRPKGDDFVDRNAEAKAAENLATGASVGASGIADLASSTGQSLAHAGGAVVDFFEDISTIFTSIRVGSGVDPKDALMLKEPRGIRNNNPGNIRLGAAWKGSVKPNTDGSFVQFTSPKWGIRAMAKVLNTYQNRHGLKSIRDMISRWAPSNENNTEAYVNAVSSFTSHDADSDYDIHDPIKLRSLMVAITRVENGKNPYPDNTYDEGIALSGVAT